MRIHDLGLGPSATRVVVVGGGPCGLACARELRALGLGDAVVLEASETWGGLAASFGDPAGFTWDRGGHVVFSHHGEFDRLVEAVMGDDLLHHDRSSYVVWDDGRRVPYPFQHHLHHLPADVALACLEGLVEAGIGGPRPAPATFRGWLGATFGTPLVETFLGPYNEKVWASDLDDLGAGWMAGRVARASWQDALRGMVSREDRPGWGPNNRFAYPRRGGTGEIFRRLGQALGPMVRRGVRVAAVDATAAVVTTSEGDVLPYDRLVWTAALDALVTVCADAPRRIREAARELRYTSVTIVGLGYRTPLRDQASWLYFPGKDVPFYRATNLAKYSPFNVPGGDVESYSSWMVEVARAPDGGPDHDLVERADAALRRAGLVPRDAAVVSVHVDDIRRAYPIPTVGRDAALAVIVPWFEARGIHPRGRFGLWRYETGNMDHAVKMGIDVARRIVGDEPEALVPAVLRVNRRSASPTEPPGAGASAAPS